MRRKHAIVLIIMNSMLICCNQAVCVNNLRGERTAKTEIEPQNRQLIAYLNHDFPKHTNYT